MEFKKLIILFIIFFIIGIIFFQIGNTNNGEKIDLFYVDMNSNFSFEKDIEYFIDSSHIEIIGDYFYKNRIKDTANNNNTTDFYYNAKVTNVYNQEYYIIVVLNDGARTNMFNGNLKNSEGIIYEIDDKIQKLQIQSLENSGVNDYENIYSIYLGVSIFNMFKIIGGCFILTAIICTLIFGIQKIKKINNCNKSN